MQLNKGVKRHEPTWLVALKVDDFVKAEPIPKSIEEVLRKFQDVMPEELPKTLPPNRSVDYEIELVLRAKPPV